MLIDKLFYYSISIFYAQWQNTMSILVRLPPTATLLAFGVIIYISPTCELNIFCSNLLLLAMPAFCSLLFHSYYAKIYAGKIDLSLVANRKEYVKPVHARVPQGSCNSGPFIVQHLRM